MLYVADYVLAQSARAVLPRDVNGPFGQHLGMSVGGGLNWALRVSAFVTERTNPADWNRYSLVVLNWCALSFVCTSVRRTLTWKWVLQGRLVVHDLQPGFRFVDDQLPRDASEVHLSRWRYNALVVRAGLMTDSVADLKGICRPFNWVLA